MALRHFWWSVALLLGPGVCFGQTTHPSTNPSADFSETDPAATLKSATERVTARFADSDQGRALADQVTAAEKNREAARASGSGTDLSAAAMQFLSAKAAYSNALQAQLDADPEVLAAAKIHTAAVVAERQPPDLNKQILAIAIKNIGIEVGDGECWTLADEAMKSAKTTHPDTYVWGRVLATNDTVLPGDIIQFTSVHLQNGSWWMILGEPNHTAVVRDVISHDVYVVLQQNAGKAGKTVSQARIDLNTMTSGKFVIYRPGSTAEDSGAHAEKSAVQ